MDEKMVLHQQKVELININKQEEEKKLNMPGPGEMGNVEEEVDLVFESSDIELEKRLNDSLMNPEVNTAIEMQEQKNAYNFVDPIMVEKTKEVLNENAEFENAPENTVLLEEQKNEAAINIVDVKNAEKKLDITKLEEGKKQQGNALPEQKKKEEKKPANQGIPDPLKETMRSIIGDQRSASEYYSGVQEAAKTVLELDANAESEVVQKALANLMNAAILYRDKRSGSRILKKGKERAAWMDALIDGMKDFTMEQEPIIMYRITEQWEGELANENGYPKHLSRWMKKEAKKIPSNDAKSKVSEAAYLKLVSMKYENWLKEKLKTTSVEETTQEKESEVLRERTEEEMGLLEERAKIFKLANEKVKDEAALFRMNCSLEAKAECGFHAFKTLSSFSGLCDEELLKKYGNKEGTEGRNEVMETLTKHILDYNPDGFGELSDGEIAKNAPVLENLSRQVTGYQKLLAQNGAFVNKLKGETAEGGSNRFDLLQERLSRLSAVSDYYRIRKMILMDSEYTQSKKEIGTQKQKTDSKSTVRLKEMIALSAELLKRAKNTPKENDETRKEMERKIHQLEIENLSSVSYQERKTMSYKSEPNEVMAPTAAAMVYGGEAAKILNLEKYRQETDPNYEEEKEELRKKYMVDQRGKTHSREVDNKYTEGKKYKGLGKFSPMDKLERMHQKMLYMSRTMGMSKEEENEWYLNLGIDATKEYEKAQNEQDAEKKEKAMTYLEEAYADACMQSLILHNGIFEKLVEMLGQDVFLMHREDMVRRLTEEQILVWNVAATITNIVLSGGVTNKNNKALIEFVNDYKEKHPEADVIDVEKFVMVSTAYSSVLIKGQIGNALNDYYDVKEGIAKYGEYDIYDMEKYDNALRSMISPEELRKWVKEQKKDPSMAKYMEAVMISFKEDKDHNETDEIMSSNLGKVLGLYLYFHPEMVKKENLNLSSDKEADKAMFMFGTGLNPDMIELAKNGVIKPRTVEEIEQYEESLKSRNMNAQRFFTDADQNPFASTADPYLMHDQYAMIVAYVEGKDAREEPVTERERQEVVLAKFKMAEIEKAEARQKKDIEQQRE